MNSWPILVTILIVHAFMCVAVLVNAIDVRHKTLVEKVIYLAIALVIPILGPIIINIVFGIKPSKDLRFSNVATSQFSDETLGEIREWLDTNTKSSNSSISDSSSSTGDGGGGDSGGGGGGD